MPVVFVESLSNLFGLLWLLLPVAAASGWWMARRSDQRGIGPPRGVRTDYFRGLNYLLDDKPDQALEVFARMAESDRETVETQIMLGNLFRHRGEVDRAIHIHHQLTVRGDLSPEQRQRATLELAEDYLRAGLFDRAETLYRTLIDHANPGEHTAEALQRLLKLYEQEKDWQQAIQHCDLLEQLTGKIRLVEAAQYCCELALQSLTQDRREDANRWLHEALRRHPRCSRASLLLAQLAQQHGDHQLAIQVLMAVEHQNPAFLSEALLPLEQCHAALDQVDRHTDWLYTVQKRYRYGWLTAHLASHLFRLGKTSEALDFLTRELHTRPSFIGLRTLVEIKLHRSGMDRDELQTLYQASNRMLDGAARYRCDQCGFTVKTLHWQCPSCKQWESVKPLSDLLCRPIPD
jgi:lipopolysaccharide assembly protein B